MNKAATNRMTFSSVSFEENALGVLKDVFGHDEFRPGQLECMDAIASGRDTSVIMPTGGGKSLCFQIPAMVASGCALVISPLIALMKDQVDSLQEKGISAAFLNSSLEKDEYDEILRNFEDGLYKMLYIAPERFKNHTFMAALRRQLFDISFMAVDEAHCHPAGTTILTPTGTEKIEELEPCDGDSPHVLTSDGPQPIKALKRRMVRRSKLISLTFSDDPYSPLDITEDHPIFLEGVGYVPAGFLKEGDTCHAVDSVSALREGIPVQIKGAREESIDFLFSGVLEEREAPFDRDENLPDLLRFLYSQEFLDSDLLLDTVWAIKGSRLCVGSNDPRQSNEAGRRATEGIRLAKDSGFDWGGEPGWEWSPDVYTTEDGWRVVSFFGLGISGSDREDEGWSPPRSEGGLGRPEQKTGSRSGRNFSQDEESPIRRPKEGGRSDSGRMVLVESIKRGRIVQGGSSEVEVFSLEVGGPHNYFAEGILVHNCISQWGHDFRIDYRRLGEYRKSLRVPVIALTATATVKVQDDIESQLNMENPLRKVTGFDRPNLTFEIEYMEGEFQKQSAFDFFIDKLLDEYADEGYVHPLIVYVGRRKDADQLATSIHQQTQNKGYGGCLIRPYHAGMSDSDRKDVQEGFMSGQVPWVAATNAFGMGVDKPDIRHVIHYTMPGSIEAYYQEVGRAGRDGDPARCIMFTCRRDEGLQWFFHAMANPSKDVITKTHDLIWGYRQMILRRTYAALYAHYADLYKDGTSDGTFATAIRLLKKSRAIDPSSPRGQLHLPAKKPDLDDLFDWKALSRKAQHDEDRLNEVVDFVKSSKDKRKLLLGYFGDESA